MQRYAQRWLFTASSGPIWRRRHPPIKGKRLFTGFSQAKRVGEQRKPGAKRSRMYINTRAGMKFYFAGFARSHGCTRLQGEELWLTVLSPSSHVGGVSGEGGRSRPVYQNCQYEYGMTVFPRQLELTPLTSQTPHYPSAFSIFQYAVPARTPSGTNFNPPLGRPLFFRNHSPSFRLSSTPRIPTTGISASLSACN